MKFFQLCLMATVLSFGSACSKKLNSKPKEILVQEENALKSKKLQEEEAKVAKVKADEDSRAANAILATSLVQEVVEANLALYQVILNSHINNTSKELKIAEVTTSNRSDLQAELDQVRTLTGKDEATICKVLMKNLKDRKDSDEIALKSASLISDIESVSNCTNLKLAEYITVADLKALCAPTLAVKLVIEEEVKTEVKATEEIKDEAKVKVKVEVEDNDMQQLPENLK